MQKILLLGKNGMLGQMLNYELRITNYEFVSWNRQDLDITQKSQVIKKISEIKPDIVINATGYTDVDGAESDRQKAFAVNADAVGYIAQACSQINATLIHFSTDYVFDGTQPSGYVEDDIEHLKPLNSYGESKRMGELLITCPPQSSRLLHFAKQSGQVACESRRVNYELRKYFIIRTSWLYGAGGKNFVDAMISKAKAGQQDFKIVDDQFGLPTYTYDLTERVLWMIERIDQLESGVYHITNSKFKTQISKPQLKTKNFMKPAGITWYEFVIEIFRLARKLGILSKLPNVKSCTSDEFPRPAKRPKYGVLINTKLPEMREWKQALCAYLKTQNSKFKTTT